MSELIIYRIQDKDGHGPWKHGFSKNWVEDGNDLDNLVPGFSEFPDALRKSIAGMAVGFGCRNETLLRRWFTPGEYEKLRGFGYSAVRMIAGRILGESDIQCFFERCKPLREGAEVFELYPHGGPK